jgi:hypothetical protein
MAIDETRNENRVPAIEGATCLISTLNFLATADGQDALVPDGDAPVRDNLVLGIHRDNAPESKKVGLLRRRRVDRHFRKRGSKTAS